MPFWGTQSETSASKASGSSISFALNAECGDGRARIGRERRVLRIGGPVGAGDQDLAGAGEGETVEAGAAIGLAGGL